MKYLAVILAACSLLAGCGGGGGSGAPDARDADAGGTPDVGSDAASEVFDAAPDVFDADAAPDVVNADAAPDVVDAALDVVGTDVPDSGAAPDGPIDVVNTGDTSDGAAGAGGAPSACLLAGSGGAGGAGGTAGSPPPSCAGATGDFDGDGIVDCAKLVAGSSGYLSVELHKGLPTNTYATEGVTTPDVVFSTETILTVYDLNHDGRQDIITSGLGGAGPLVHLSLLGGKVDGTFSSASAFSMGSSVSLYPDRADFNGDGRDDLLFATWADSPYSPRLGVFAAASDGTVSAPWTDSSSIFSGFSRGAVGVHATADVNKDGKADLIASAIQGPTLTATLIVLLNDGSGRFTGAAIDHTDGYVAGPMTVQDLDGDGKLDLAVPFAPSTSYDSSGPTVPFFGDGAGHFTPPAPVDATTSCAPGPAGGTTAPLGDFDGDGKLDCVFVESGSTSVTVKFRQGVTGGRFRAQTVATPNVPVGGAISIYKVLDLDGDGRADLLLQYQDQSKRYVILLLRGKADGTFSLPSNPPPASSTSATKLVAGATGDFDGDRRNDSLGATILLPATGPQAGPLCLTTISAVGAAVDAKVREDCDVGGFLYSTAASVLAVADVNNDGILDAVLRVAANDAAPAAPYRWRLVIALGDGTGHFKIAPSGAAGIANTETITAAKPVDCNGDGKVDLLVATSYSSTPRWTAIMHGDGEGRFTW